MDSGQHTTRAKSVMLVTFLKHLTLPPYTIDKIVFVIEDFFTLYIILCLSMKITLCTNLIAYGI